jgi:hypothetical protein
MLRNIPNNLSTPTLFTLLSSLIDYLYLPIDFNVELNNE